MFWAVWSVVLLAQAVEGEEVCYERIGCFTNNYPWSGTLERPIAKLPWSPEVINVRFLLYTRENPTNFQELQAVNISSISASNFKTNRKSRFIIHGFYDTGEQNWLKNMCKQMFEVEDVNCFCVDWRRGSRTLYTRAANNIRVVGAELAYFLDTLQNNFGYSLSNVHLIGHSLGAHTAGEAGKRKPGIARITGLDPAGPYFQGTPIEVRIDPSDAAFVDIIHTDVAPLIPFLGFGMKQTVGHVDFYPNGGKDMSGCDKSIFSRIIALDGIMEGIMDVVLCNHLKSYKYYTDSILYRDGYIGFPSPSYAEFKSGTGFPCPNDGCPLMGHYADTYSKITSTSQTFYLNTGDLPSYARWRYKVSVEITGSTIVLGYLKVAVYGTKGNTQLHDIFNGIIISGRKYTNFLHAEKDVGTLTHVKFVWRHSLVNIFRSRIGAKSINVQYGKDGTMRTFCGRENVKDNVPQTLSFC
ncbi:inactive pancreatic lipase-related protein 1-like [Bombina bombina]|uniref:inactive pancreatic lipase-related protein 1-like n=1 Tax=Bombina bombina TaxID=8345 RepID=UPI00235AEFF0|nr:inactive pancreatic lipase-related protein 1-like [Bombina bombina]